MLDIRELEQQERQMELTISQCKDLGRYKLASEYESMLADVRADLNEARNHEMWLLEQQEGNLKGGSQSWDM